MSMTYPCMCYCSVTYDDRTMYTNKYKYMSGESPIYLVHTNLIKKKKDVFLFMHFQFIMQFKICNPYIRFVKEENRVRDRETEVVSASS